MKHVKDALLVISLIAIALSLSLILTQRNMANQINYVDARTALTTSTAIFGSMLGIITAGLMFTQGKYIELSSEFTEKLPDYLGNVLTLEKMQSIGMHLSTLRKTFSQLAASSTIPKEKRLYERVASKASSMLVHIAVLLNLMLKQQGLPDTDLLVSEMDHDSYQQYDDKRRGFKRNWQVLDIILQVIRLWEAPGLFSAQGPEGQSALQVELWSSISILKIREETDKALVDIRDGVAKASGDISDEISRISRRIHGDGIPQLLSQMKHADTIRGKYFHLALVFIATPLLINLMVLPQLSETTATFLQPIISATSVLSVMGVIFLLLYIRRILNVP